MSDHRHANLQQFLDALQAAFDRSHMEGLVSATFPGKLFAALETTAARGSSAPAFLPVCNHLPTAYQTARTASPAVARLAIALEQIAPSLTWKVRSSGGAYASDNWPEGHANAVIVGEGGLEERSDIAIGASLLAPHVRYPDHTHPPEELYLVMTPGHFQHGDSDWCEPGPGGTFHNTPNIKHAMTSRETPLLAIWTMLT